MNTLVHAVAGYFILLLIVRVLRRRAGSQMTLFEFVLVFLIGGVIILSTVGKDRSVTNCTCAAIAVALLHRSLAWAKSKSPLVGALLDGTPMVVVKRGQWQAEVMEREGLQASDLEAAARSQGLTSTNEIDYAVLERNGGLSIIRKD